MYDDESMDDRAEKLQTEIGSSPLRSLRDSLNSGRGREQGKRDGRTVSSRTKWRDFCYIPPPLTFIFLPPLLILSTLYFPRWMTLSSTLFLYVFAVLCFLVFQWSSVDCASTSNAFLTSLLTLLLFLIHDGYRWLRLFPNLFHFNKIFKDNLVNFIS